MAKPAAPLAKNYATAVLLLGFVAGVYYISIAKMRQTVRLYTFLLFESLLVLSLCCLL